MNGPQAVRARNLTVRFGGFTAVDDISFDVSRGEIFGFLGANGAGKTTTIRVLCGLLVPTSGEAEIAGVPVSLHPAGVKAKVGYMSQRFTLYDDLTVEENIRFAAALRRMEERAAKARRKELFDFIGFAQPAETLVRDLPGGIKQQVSLVAAMLHDPEIIFLDEPTAGVSPAARARFWELIGILASRGKTIFVTTHYMDEAEQCRRIALMREGKIIALDTPAALKQSAFQEPLYELDPGPGAPPGWLHEIEQGAPAWRIRPHGLRHHLTVLDAAAWERFYPRIERFVRARRITPSLEDVFMRLVEREER